MEHFTGVVENRYDPMKLGRCQVRVVGLHSEEKSELPTRDLPWAHVMQPTTSAAISGIGHTPLGPVEGTWVVVIFRDYPENQQPIIIGTVGGIPQEQANFVDKQDDGLILNDDMGVPQGEGFVTDKDGVKHFIGQKDEISLNATPEYDGLRPSRDFSAVTSECIDLIKQFEGLRLNAYQDSVGVWTVGFGTTVIDGNPVQANRSITEAEANALLLKDLNEQFLPGVKAAVRTLVTQSMIDALCVFSYNVGLGSLRRSTLLKELNAGRYLDAASRFQDWKYAGGQILQGLVRRREAEKNLFLSDGLPNVAGDLSQFGNDKDPVDSDGSNGMNDNGFAAQYGFGDPAGKYPLYINEPDTNRLARHEQIGKTTVFKKEGARDKNVAIANSTTTWDQSPIPYNTEYPFNHVFMSESGHIMEFDDTARSERINIEHRSGTFTEIDANGTQVNRIVGDGYEILERDGYLHILGSQNVTIEGAQKVKVVNTLDLEVDGATTINIYNDATVNVSGDAKMSVGGEYALRAETIKMEATGNMDILSGGTLNVDYDRGNFGESAASSGLSAPAEKRSPTLPSINELTVITRGASTAQLFESIDEGDSEYYRVDQLERGNIPSDDIDSGTIATVSEAVSPITLTAATPPTKSCNLINNMENLSASLVLSKHFTLGSLCSNGTKMPVAQFGLTKQEIACNLKGIAENCLEPIIELYPNVVVTQGFRRPTDSSISPTFSQHYLGQAVDLVFPGFSRVEVFAIINELKNVIPHDELLLEYSGKSTVWIHLSWKYEGNRFKSYTFRDHKQISDVSKFALVE